MPAPGDLQEDEWPRNDPLVEAWSDQSLVDVFATVPLSREDDQLKE
jgi:hypothetical protein